MAHQPPALKWKVDTETIAFPWSDHDALKILSKETLQEVKEAEYRKSLSQKNEDQKGWWDDSKLHIKAVLKAHQF
jgi:hypothetical protein